MSLLKAWDRESYSLGHNTEFKVDPFAKYGGESMVNKLAQEGKKGNIQVSFSWSLTSKTSFSIERTKKTPETVANLSSEISQWFVLPQKDSLQMEKQVDMPWARNIPKGVERHGSFQSTTSK